MIPSSNITALGVSMIIAIVFPIALTIWFYRKRRISFIPVLVGAATFFVFAGVLEQIMHYFVFKSVPGLKNNTLMFVLYGSLAAGVFEECGRFIAFKFVLKKKREWKDGIAYGIGHGGIEALLVGGLGLLGSFVTAIMMNNGSFPFDTLPAEAKDQLLAAQKQLTETAWPVFLLGGLERVMAMITHIGFSMIVLYGVRNNRIVFLLYAILLHALMDTGAALYQKGILNIWIVEGIVAVFAVVSVIMLKRSETHFPPLEAPVNTSSQENILDEM